MRIRTTTQHREMLTEAGLMTISRALVTRDGSCVCGGDMGSDCTSGDATSATARYEDAIQAIKMKMSLKT